jgi:hypothetical protein
LVRHLSDDPHRASLGVCFTSVILSFILASTARELTRLLEGYTIWPPSLKLAWTKKQQERRTDLLSKIAESQLLADKVRLREELNQYPRKANLVLPTRLGNALRAGETYGWVQYGLSTVDMWTRLTAVAEDKINNQLVESRAVLNFYIALIWLSLALCFATVVVTVWAGKVLLLLWLVPLLGLIPLWYRRSVATVSWYSQGMQALVDLTRGKLAETLGIQLPGDLKEERKIWKAVSDYAAWGPGWTNSADWIKVINEATVQRGATDESSQVVAAQLTPGQPIPVQLTPGQPAPAQPTSGQPRPSATHSYSARC